MGLSEKIQLIDRRILVDSRGYFLKVLTGTEEGLPAYTGEIYLTSAKPGEAKGGHYHPKANEWFTLIQGECELKLTDIKTGEKLAKTLHSSEPCTVYIPNNVAHTFLNTSNANDFLLLAYTDQLYDPIDTIPFAQ
ncbi:polysaccharide biosynthesis C-terminal domain-containing protein [Hymenobacter mucosus]|uniref:polysaccharide biosynthesis C-terminal domain-containing protein n=1 Tax=Hymenobacter mucosus TaxID=1411120 RepID=UPI000B7866A1|nr:WxcM-like domain-containing protein [Hymenobacter mucosus]